VAVLNPTMAFPDGKPRFYVKPESLLRLSDWFAGEGMEGLRGVGIGPDRGADGRRPLVEDRRRA
jgi:hypothetical protein